MRALRLLKLLNQLALHALLKHAYDVYVTTIRMGPPESFRGWCSRRKDKSPQFLYWFTNLELELLVLAYVRSLRTGDFDLYVHTLTKLTQWFFSLNHTMPAGHQFMSEL